MVLARWQANTQDEEGNLILVAQVTVRREAPGLPLATLFSDRDGLVPLGNPFWIDQGQIGFHVAGGAYKVDAVAGAFSRTWRYVGVGLAQESDGVTPTGTDFEFLDIAEDVEPASPDVDKLRIYAVATDRIQAKNSSGVVTDLTHFLQAGSGARVRSQIGKLGEVLSATDFGAIGDGTSHPLSEQFASLGAAQAVYPHATALTDEIDWAAIQAGLDVLEAAGGGRLVLPALDAFYVVNQPLVYESLSPISLYGLGSTAGKAANVRVALQYTGIDASTALEFRTPGVDHLNGVEVKNLTIFRSTAQAQGDDGIGLALKGVRPFILENITISGFDVGWLMDEVSGIRCGYGHVAAMRIRQAASYRAWIRATAGMNVYSSEFETESIAGYLADLRIEAGSVTSARSDGNTFYGCTFIGGAGTQPDFNALVVDSLFINFEQCAFEQAGTVGVSVVNNTLVTEDVLNVSLTDCWWDAQTGFAIDVQRARVAINNPRIAHVSTTDPAIRFVGDPTTATRPRIGGSVNGGLVAFNDTAAVQVLHATGVDVHGTEFHDYSGTNLPAVLLGSNTEDCRVTNIRRSANTGGITDAGVLNLYEAEGDWTPTLEFGNVTTGITYSIRQGRYKVVGKVVTVHFRILLTSKGAAAGAATLSGLPFLSVNQGYMGGSGGVLPYAVSMTGLTGGLIAHLGQNSNEINFFQTVAGGVTGVTNTVFTNASDIAGTLVYERQ